MVQRQHIWPAFRSTPPCEVAINSLLGGFFAEPHEHERYNETGNPYLGRVASVVAFAPLLPKTLPRAGPDLYGGHVIPEQINVAIQANEKFPGPE